MNEHERSLTFHSGALSALRSVQIREPMFKYDESMDRYFKQQTAYHTARITEAEKEIHRVEAAAKRD